MIYPTTKLSKVYYYIANTVVYDISNKYIKDNDNCAINPIVYTNKDKNEANEIETAKIFPCFTVTYKKGTETIIKYYWLQDMISDGDTYTSNKFTMNTHGQTGKTYLSVFQEAFTDEIKNCIKSGISLKNIKSRFPHYCFATHDYEYVNGFKYVSVTGFTPLTDEQLQQLVIEVTNEMIIDNANSLLNKNSLKVKDNVTLLTKNDVEQKEETATSGS